MELDDFKRQLEGAFSLTQSEVSKLRIGRANASLIEDIRVNAYEGSQPLKIIELATITVPEPQTLMLQVFDAGITDKVAKAIMEANIGLTPNVAGSVIRINIPPLSQERRQELIKVLKRKVEDGKVLIRQHRRQMMEDIRQRFEDKKLTEDEVKRLEKEVQSLVDEYNQRLEDLYKEKEDAILKVE